MLIIFAQDSTTVSYTHLSDPDRNQLLFMKQMGYAICGDVMNVVNTSVLGADSILGVKYVLSSYDIPGLKKLENIEPGNGKSVYYNPYALPVAFTYESSNMLQMCIRDRAGRDKSKGQDTWKYSCFRRTGSRNRADSKCFSG